MSSASQPSRSVQGEPGYTNQLPQPVGSKPIPRFVQQLQEIGRTIEDTWDGHEGSEFVSVAVQQLQHQQLHLSFDEKELLTWLRNTSDLPTQLDPLSLFGNPPITIWWNDRFVVDLYFWVDSNTTFHDHAFAGAFVNLVGRSFQAEYVFKNPSRVTDGIVLGELLLKDSRVIHPAHVQPIEPGEKFIHSVWHLDIPTITVVVRTRQLAPRIEQLDYYPGGVATNKESSLPSITRQRRREMFSYLFARNHPKKLALAKEMILNADAIDAFWYLRVLPGLLSPKGGSAIDGIVRKLAKIHGEWITTAHAGRRADKLLRDVYWSRLKKWQHRLLVAALCTYNDKNELGRFLEREFHTKSWKKLVATWISQMAACNAIKTSVSECTPEVFLKMIDGKPVKTVIQELSQDYSIDHETAQEMTRALGHLKALQVFRPLFAAERPRLSR